MNPNKLKKLELVSYTRKLLILYNILLIFPRLTYFLKRYIGDYIFLKRETRLNRFFRYGFTLTGGGNMLPEDNRAMKFQIKSIIGYLTGIVKADKNRSNKPVIWAEWNLSSEIFKAFDVQIYIPETPAIFGHIKGNDINISILEETEAEGVPMEYCSASKAAIGSYLLKQSPDPDLIVTSSHPCDSMVSSYQSLHNLTQAPFFVLDSPYWRKDESYEYYTKNIWRLIEFLEKNLNQKLDWDKLKEACENLNTANYYLQELSEISRAIPNPVSVQTLVFAWLGRIASIGTEGNAKFAEMLYNNAMKRLKKGKGYLKKEKIRMIWWDVPLAYSNIYPWLENEFGATVVADFFGRVQATQIDTSSKEKMIADMARNGLNVTMARQMRGPVEFYTDELQKLIDEYSGDCFIFMRHQGCSHGWAFFKMVRDVCKRSGLPALFLSTDIFDPRVLSEEQIKKEITEFFQNNGLV